MTHHVGVLGAGIMGSATALFLARRGVRVTLFDAADRPCARASRWNEGKIHLGYLYAGDPSLATARRLLPGGLSFQRLTEELVGESIAPAVSEHDDVYAVHRDSVVTPDAAAAYYEAVATLVAAAGGGAGYLGTTAATRPRRLSRIELEHGYDTTQVAAAFRVAERSVSTPWVADRFVAALASEPRVEQRMDTRVSGIRTTGGHFDGPFYVETSTGGSGPYDVVVNALWEGRLAVDARLGLPAPLAWSHRHRLSVFLTLPHAVDVPSTVIATGPFGDVKNYNGRDLYLSWYTTGLVAEGTDVAPPELPSFGESDRAARITGVVERLAAVVPSVRAVQPWLDGARLAGGWVYAAGRGSLADPGSTLHQRHRVGIQQVGRYFSVDTGKYSVAPWLARQVVEALL